MAFSAPSFSRGRVDKAGHAFRDKNISNLDVEILENWRASHLYVINTFQSALRNRKKRLDAPVSIAQRLKRRPTIIDKLQREPEMELSRMHDIAGCRLIFPDIATLIVFRDGVHQARVQHELIGGDDRYDYIKTPKSSGYRGVHDVFKYKGRNAKTPWDKLRIEIQYRTLVQHAWATAVEISDIVNSTRLKFGEAAADLEELFKLSSEILARSEEGMTGCYPEESNTSILDRFHDLENRLHAVARLRQLVSPDFRRFARSARLFILVNPLPENVEDKFFARGFSDNKTALEQYAILEKEYAERADVVLVGANEQDAIRLAYTNYFSDASEFLTYLDSSLKILKSQPPDCVL